MPIQARTSFYFIRTDNLDAYELSATTDISVSKQQTVTSRRVESGKSVADNAYTENTIISFDGIITNIKNKSNVVNTDQFINEVDQIIEDKILIDVVSENQVYPKCLINNFELKKSHVEGKGGWKVSLSFKQVEFTNRAKLVEVPEAQPNLKPDVDPTSKTSNNTVQSEDKEVYETFFGTVAGGAAKMFIPFGSFIPDSIPEVGDGNG